ncbi:MAG TPA: ribonuclease III [Paludibaculum sp.]|jgi:ribonuclease-3
MEAHFLEELELRLGYTFSNRALLLRALTHKSLLVELPPDPEAGLMPRDNEQLEFLGDAILGFLASDHLVRRCPTYPEGKLSKLKAHLVSAVQLHEVAKRLGVGSHLRLGKGEETNGGRQKKALLANSVEAIIAAIYLDAGLVACDAFLARHVWSVIPDGEPEETPVPIDSKSALQELAQARKLPVPRYAIVHMSGPEHERMFTVEARIGKDFTARAEGPSKKVASQRAARELLDHLRAEVRARV